MEHLNLHLLLIQNISSSQKPPGVPPGQHLPNYFDCC